MEFLIDHLLALRLTNRKSMKTSIDIQHEQFARQLSSMEKLLVLSHSKLSLDELHKNLKLVLKAGNKGMLKIVSIDSLIECIELYKATNSTEDSEKISDFFDEFLAEVKRLAKVNKFFHETIYHCLYEFFYDPLQDNSDDEFPNDESSDDEEDNMDDEKHSADEKGETSPAPLKDFTVQVNPPKKRKKKKKKKTRKNLLNNVKNKRKRVDNRLKVLEQIQREKAEREARLPHRHKLEEKQSGREFEKLKNKTDKQRLAFVVKKMFNIKMSWDELITTGSIPTRCFEDDSLRLVKDYKGYLPFEPIFRLLPDILAKGFKLVELSKIWYNSARRLAGSQPAMFQTIRNRFALIESEDKKVEEMEREIRSLKDERTSRQTERKLLVNQILRFDEVKEKCELCVEREQELKDYYKQLKEERNAEYPKLDKLARDDMRYKETYDQIQYLAESMKGVYRELQTASYELELVKQDYTVGMSNRTNLIHMQNDVKAAIQDIDISLPINKERLAKSCHLCDKLRANIARMWVALYKVAADELLNEQADILLQSKYSDQLPINNLRNTAATGSVTSESTDGEAELLEEALDNTLSHEMDHNTALKRENSDNSGTGKSPPPPLPPTTSNMEPDLIVKEKSVFNSEYRPSTAGILDKHEAKEYRQRVDRLKKKFELDLSNLRTTVDCHVDVPVVESVPEQKNVQSGEVVASGDEADMESDQEERKSNRPQSKKLVKRNEDRYSPLSDASDEYLYQQQVKKQPTGNPTKTIYILKKSIPKAPPQNRYMLKTVPGAKLQPQKTMYQQQKASDNSRRPRPHERQWGNDYETLQALDNKYVGTLSMNKKSPFMNSTHAFSDTPVLPLEHHDGIFTPNVVLSDGDISIDSGTGNSLDSDDDDKERAKKSNKITAGYKHKPRVSVRKQLASTQISPTSNNQKPANQKQSRLPRLQKNKPPPRLPAHHKLLSVESPPLSKSSPESLESRPIVVKKPATRNTLHMKKKVQPPPAVKHTEKPVNEVHPLAPTHKVMVKKGVERKLPLGKIPKSIAQPKIAPKKQYGRVIDSPSDDDIDEIFKQSTSQRTLPPKPSMRVHLQPQRAKRKYGIQHSLAKVR